MPKEIESISLLLEMEDDVLFLLDFGQQLTNK